MLVFPVWVVASRDGVRQLSGHVAEADGRAMPFVSVYMKDNPYVGTVTDDQGAFTLDIPPEDRGDEVVFSFIGYRTVRLPVADIPEGEPLVVTLVEQPILLDDTEVSAKISRKQSRKMKQAVLARFFERMRQDFPYRTSTYRVVSSYHGGQDERQLIRHEIIGTIEEYPANEQRKTDSVVVTHDVVREFTSEEVLMGYDKLNDMAEKKLGFEKRDLDRRMLDMHRYLWGGYTGGFIEMIEGAQPDQWDYTTVGEQNVLTFTEKKNLLGILKLKLQLFFYVEPATMAVEKIAQSLEAELHIPFGYKLSDEELEFINILQLQDETLDKYRLRHAYLDVKRNVMFKQEAGKRVVQEKNLRMKVTVADRKNKTLNYNAQAKLLVTGQPLIEEKP